VLANYGNMSSPSVLFVLAEALARRTPQPGTYGVLAGFGPGLGIEAALMRFE
jgi:predicted naringenin-chalcone synthase